MAADDDEDEWTVIEVAAEGDGGPVDTAVVLLHGWGAPGDDLVALADELVRPGLRCFAPEGPLVEVGGGRAWWYLDEQRPVHAWDDQLPEGHRPHPQVDVSRALVLGLIADIRARYQPRALVLAGFSQGGMLALAAGLAARPPVDRIAVLSGVLLADALPALHAPDAPRPPVLISHGREDPLLRFGAGERASQILSQHGFPVTWLPFAGGHEIPEPVLAELRTFLAATPATSSA